MVKCIRCNEPIVHFSPIPCVCDTCYAVDDLPRHAEAPNMKPSRKLTTYRDGDLMITTLDPRYYQ
jgi:hypothetical protein